MQIPTIRTTSIHAIERQTRFHQTTCKLLDWNAFSVGAAEGCEALLLTHRDRSLRQLLQILCLLGDLLHIKAFKFS